MNTVLEAMIRDKIISIIRGVSSQDIVSAVAALSKGGVHFVEVTFNPASEEASARPGAGLLRPPAAVRGSHGSLRRRPFLGPRDRQARP